MDCSTPGFLIHHQLSELAETQVHGIPDASNHLILSHPLLLGLHSFLVSGSFPMRQFFASGGQSTGVAASASVFND